ncbi:MAG: prepilin-type N-terminal cleavage/methylation domain-containing protein [Gemmatimonadota bacterium]|nr:prepilin-type N-terminal cleavage/methylation domain-containing protein [Gemmatimonadota bacterium]
MSAATPRGQAGFSLVEALVAIVLVSVVVLGLAPVMFDAASRQAVDSGGAERDAILLGEANRLSTLPVQALAGEAGCRTLPPQAHNYEHDLCVTVQPMGGAQVRVGVSVTPDADLVQADSVVLYRRAGGQGNPFNTGGSP